MSPNQGQIDEADALESAALEAAGETLDFMGEVSDRSFARLIDSAMAAFQVRRQQAEDRRLRPIPD